MATKKAPAREQPIASKSQLRAGTGSKRDKNKFIVIYGPPKSRKTGSCINLPKGRTKWIAADTNCISTLDALNALPHQDDIYEIDTLPELKQLTNEMLDLAGSDKDALGIDYLVLDSATHYSDSL